MAEEIDLRFLGEQIKRLQGDVRQVKSDMVAVKADLNRADGRLEAFRETVDDRFDQQIELVKLTFGRLSQEIALLRDSVDGRFERVDGRFEQIDRRFDQIDGRFEQQLELIKSGFATLSQEIATLKKS
jgi:chromosome segregation ATPase